MTEDIIQQPTGPKERILSLDVLRGFAILGILIMNIQSFAMPGAAYLNPTAYGDLTGLNKWVWVFSHILGDQKFMTIFSILFGSGIIIFTQSAERKTGKSARLHYRRNFWLLLIGLFHAHMIWYGDILVPYALCASFAFLFRNLNPKKLVLIGGILISVHTLLYLGIGISLRNAPEEATAGPAESWMPAPEAIEREIAAYTGSFVQQMAIRSEEALFLEIGVFLMLFLWRAGGLMLIGMALYRWGILSAEKSDGFYRRGAIVGSAIGFPVVIFGVARNFQADWSLKYSMFIGSQFNYWGSLAISFAFICIIMLMVRSRYLEGLKKRLAAVGQMALTNYLAQSIICTFIFYGFGLGLFGQIDRTGQVLIMAGVWMLQLIWSPFWLRKYRFGPFEWAWRSLTYMRTQPMSK